MTTPTFNTQQLDIPETAVADRDAAPRESRNGRIDTARFWVGAALTAGISAMVALIALIITNDLLHIPGHDQRGWPPRHDRLRRVRIVCRGRGPLRPPCCTRYW